MHTGTYICKLIIGAKERGLKSRQRNATCVKINQNGCQHSAVCMFTVKCSSAQLQPREFIAGLMSVGRAFKPDENGQCLQSVKWWPFNYNKNAPAPVIKIAG